MVEGIVGEIKTGIVMSLDFQTEGPKGGDISTFVNSAKLPIVKGSKALEKGHYMTFEEPKASEDNTEYYVVFQDQVNTIQVFLERSDINSQYHIYCQIPKAEDYNCSSFYVKGNFNILKVHIAPAKKTILGEDIMKRIKDHKTICIDKKLFISEIGPPLLTSDVISHECGDIQIIKPQLNVEV